MIQHLPDPTTGRLALACAGLYILYSVCLSVYRLFLSPLAKVPGPRLAAVTAWVETYYECFKAPGGQLMWAYQRWHEEYGPIVRISPNEVHIQDATFYESLYASGRTLHRLKHYEHRFNNKLSAFASADHHLHRSRRSALNPYFSKRKIAQYSAVIQTHMERVCKRLAAEYTANDAVLNLNNMWAAFAGDVVVGYCLEKPYDFVLKPDFRAEFSNTLSDLLDPVHFITQFPWMIKALQALPDRLVVALSPPMRSVIFMNNEMFAQIASAKALRDSGEKNPQAHESVFTALLDSDLPPAEKSVPRLQHEAISIIGAGLETTMYTQSTCCFHLLSQPATLATLQAELRAAIPDPARPPPLDTLMQLPYLTAVITEALRLSYGITGRIPRTSPDPIVYTTPAGVRHVLPPGTIVSMDNYTASNDAAIFPAPAAFVPERWLGAPHAPDGKPLQRYLVAFGKGPRSCLGMPLAYANLYVGLAVFWRRVECELWETGREAVEPVMDRFVPRPAVGTKGVRVKVRAVV